MNELISTSDLEKIVLPQSPPKKKHYTFKFLLNPNFSIFKKNNDEQGKDINSSIEEISNQTLFQTKKEVQSEKRGIELLYEKLKKLTLREKHRLFFWAFRTCQYNQLYLSIAGQLFEKPTEQKAFFIYDNFLKKTSIYELNFPDEDADIKRNELSIIINTLKIQAEIDCFLYKYTNFLSSKLELLKEIKNSNFNNIQLELQFHYSKILQIIKDPLFSFKLCSQKYDLEIKIIDILKDIEISFQKFANFIENYTFVNVTEKNNKLQEMMKLFLQFNKRDVNSGDLFSIENKENQLEIANAKYFCDSKLKIDFDLTSKDLFLIPIKLLYWINVKKKSVRLFETFTAEKTDDNATILENFKKEKVKLLANMIRELTKFILQDISEEITCFDSYLKPLNKKDRKILDERAQFINTDFFKQASKKGFDYSSFIKK